MTLRGFSRTNMILFGAKPDIQRKKKYHKRGHNSVILKDENAKKNIQFAHGYNTLKYIVMDSYISWFC